VSEMGNLTLMSDYNRWMNEHLYALAAPLGEVALREDRGAFFSSLFGTFSHILVADIIWLKRFARHPGCGAGLASLDTVAWPEALDAQPCADFAALRERRGELDALIAGWVPGLTPADLDQTLAYTNMQGEPGHRRFGSLLLHFFNHQTHHRGQITTLLSQAGVAVGVTDLLVRIPDQD